MNGFFINEKIWRYLTNFWTIILFIFLIFDFLNNNRYDFLIGPFAAIYLGVLGLFVSSKEFNRWHDHHKGEHPGEWYIVIWTVLIIILLLLNIFYNKNYYLPSEIIASYIAVLGIFAITQKSKTFYKQKTQNISHETHY